MQRLLLDPDMPLSSRDVKVVDKLRSGGKQWQLYDEDPFFMMALRHAQLCGAHLSYTAVEKACRINDPSQARAMLSPLVHDPETVFVPQLAGQVGRGVGIEAEVKDSEGRRVKPPTLTYSLGMDFNIVEVTLQTMTSQVRQLCCMGQ